MRLLLPGYFYVVLLGLLGTAPAAWGQFAPAVMYASGATLPRGLAVGDVNGDGRQDVVVANTENNAVNVLLGQAAGGFASGSTYPTTTNMKPYAVRLGDVNGDNQLDIVAAGYNSNAVSVLLGRAGGGFGSATAYAVGSSTNYNYVSSLALGDVNADGRLDIVVVNYATTTVGVLLGQASGGFAAVTNYVVGAKPFALALGDVNADGRVDIVTTSDNAGGPVAAVALGQAGGGFATASTYATVGAYAGPLALGDVNQDGRLDIVTNGFSNKLIEVLLGQAGGGFAAVSTYPTASEGKSLSLTLGDVNGDGRLDIVTTWGSSTSSSISSTYNKVDVLLNQANGGFATVSSYASGGDYVYDVALADVNKDGRPDIVVLNYLSATVGVLLNQATYLAATPATAPASSAPYPNPAHGRATVPLAAGATSLRVLDALGREVRRQAVAPAASEATLDLTGLPAGLYLVRVAGKTPVIQRLVVD